MVKFTGIEKGLSLISEIFEEAKHTSDRKEKSAKVNATKIMLDELELHASILR